MALTAGPEPWPFAGFVRGEVEGDGTSVAWVGHHGADRGPVAAWRASRDLERCLRSPGAPVGDRRRVLTVLWTRLHALEGTEDLVLLLAAKDGDGVAVSAVGLRALYALRDDRLHAWVSGEHPLLGPPGLPAELPGALVLDDLPGWLIAWDGRGPSPDGLTLEQAFARCAVHG